jgi:hypothetical protein
MEGEVIIQSDISLVHAAKISPKKEESNISCKEAKLPTRSLSFEEGNKIVNLDLSYSGYGDDTTMRMMDI